MGFVHKASQLGASSSGYLNFLWKHEERPIYVMDNHGGALWCWLMELSVADEYSMAHIDYHWDDAPTEGLELLKALPVRPSLHDVMSIPSPTIGGLPMSNGKPFPLVRWDNYLTPLPYLRPRAKYLAQATHQIEAGNPSPAFARVEPSQSGEAPLRIADAVSYERGRWLINFDLDYFFLGEGARQSAYTDDFIRRIVQRLATAAPDAVWTIAWSPECCGGWHPAARVARLVDEVLDSKFPFTDLGL